MYFFSNSPVKCLLTKVVLPVPPSPTRTSLNVGTCCCAMLCFWRLLCQEGNGTDRQRNTQVDKTRSWIIQLAKKPNSNAERPETRSTERGETCDIPFYNAISSFFFLPPWEKFFSRESYFRAATRRLEGRSW